jgi:hypothetical protein
MPLLRWAGGFGRGQLRRNGSEAPTEGKPLDRTGLKASGYEFRFNA